MKDVTQVKIGTGTLYTAPLGTTFPLDPSVAPAAAWLDIGYSDSGWNFKTDRTFEDITVAEEVDPIETIQTAQVITIAGVAVQVSLELLQLAFNAPASSITVLTAPARKQFEPPETSAAIVARALLFRVAAPGIDKVRDIRVPRAISTGAIDIPHVRGGTDAKRKVAMDFKALKPAAGKIFTYIDLT